MAGAAAVALAAARSTAEGEEPTTVRRPRQPWTAGGHAIVERAIAGPGTDGSTMVHCVKCYASAHQRMQGIPGPCGNGAGREPHIERIRRGVPPNVKGGRDAWRLSEQFFRSEVWLSKLSARLQPSANPEASGAAGSGQAGPVFVFPESAPVGASELRQGKSLTSLPGYYHAGIEMWFPSGDYSLGLMCGFRECLGAPLFEDRSCSNGVTGPAPERVYQHHGYFEAPGAGAWGCLSPLGSDVTVRRSAEVTGEGKLAGRGVDVCLSWSPPSAFEPREHLLLASIVAASQKLVADDGKLDIQSKAGYEACQRLLGALDALSHVLRLEPAPRGYRAGFASNYRALFAGDGRSYRAEILQAAMTLTPTIWSNGEFVQLSEGLVQRASALHEAWLSLEHALHVYDCCACPLRAAPGAPCMSRRQADADVRGDLCRALLALDAAWAGFEEAYVTELLGVQQQARAMVAEAAELERKLRSLERAGGTAGPRVRARQRAEARLVEALGRLHASAGAKDASRRAALAPEALDAARSALDAVRGAARDGGRSDPAQVLAERVVGSYRDLRSFLQGLRHRMGEVHPQLCKNAGLVDRLARWEESWRLWGRYCDSPELLAAVRSLARFLQDCAGVAPELLRMCEGYDADLFLVLPRLATLCLLSDPAGPAAALAAGLLPALRTCGRGGAAGEQAPGAAALPGRLQAGAAALRLALRGGSPAATAGDDAEARWGGGQDRGSRGPATQSPRSSARPRRAWSPS
ncbi:unnamed protein product [Prorocentrum cordatum]|uniref:Selenoprotein O n=1 Tax=Prorocentrum cordatum TaxID=2364126 RepID=A0ABN9VJL5_9DINO|nr:unnamed protein product [Polarella glacialis]